jgi:hypothetical protein
MKRFALIDIHSGYAWGTVAAPDPVSACRRIDRDLGEPGRRYEKHSPGSGAKRWGMTGYLVYQTPEGFWVEDGQNPTEIAAVEAHPCVAVVLVKEQEA